MKMALLISTAFATLSLVQASAAEGPILFDGSDVAPMAEFYRSQIKEFERSAKIYHWSSDRNTLKNPSEDTVRSISRSFWNNYGDPKTLGPMYGRGLYGAVDPIVTRGFGGFHSSQGPQNWLLLEMKLPVGFRVLDFTTGFRSNVPAAVQKIARDFNCPVTQDGEAYFNAGGIKLASSCQRLVKKIFKDILEIDGFVYSYAGTVFKSCAENMMAAFVITNDRWVESDLVHFYHADSKENFEDRRLIQTLFLESLKTLTNSVPLEDSASEAIENYLIEKTDYEYQSSTTVCSGATCRITARFCNDKSRCDDVLVATLPRPGGPTITAEAAAKTGFPLHWLDLEGQMKATTTETWLKDNRMKCTGASPYKQNP